MTPPRAWRLHTVAVLFALLLGLCVWYGTFGVASDLGAYPTEQVVGLDPGAYVGDLVTLSGTVVGTDPVELRVSYQGGQERTLTVTDLQTPANRGDTLHVFGTLVDERTVEVTRAYTIAASGYLYSYAVSFLAGVWVLTRLVRQWRLDTREGVVRRTDPLTLDALRPSGEREAADDA